VQAVTQVLAALVVRLEETPAVKQLRVQVAEAVAVALTVLVVRLVAELVY
jgi:hypothetical protein